jgi:hypothetical protein
MIGAMLHLTYGFAPMTAAYIILAAAVALYVHEWGHYWAARCYGGHLSYTLAWGWVCWDKIPIPRFVWAMPPGLTPGQRRFVAVMGFGAEFLSALIFCLLIPSNFWQYYLVFALIHILAYPHYAGSESDFLML